MGGGGGKKRTEGGLEGRGRKRAARGHGRAGGTVSAAQEAGNAADEGPNHRGRSVTGGWPACRPLFYWRLARRFAGPTRARPPEGGSKRRDRGGSGGGGEARAPGKAGLSISRAGKPLGRRERRTGEVTSGRGALGRIGSGGARLTFNGRRHVGRRPGAGAAPGVWDRPDSDRSGGELYFARWGPSGMLYSAGVDLAKCGPSGPRAKAERGTAKRRLVPESCI